MIKIRIIAIFIVSIIIVLTISPFIHLNSNIDSIYQSISKQMSLGIFLLLTISAYYINFRNIRVDSFFKVIYIALIICTISSIKYCIDIYDTPFLGFKISDLSFYKNEGKTSYYELDLSSEVKAKNCILYTPTSFNYGKCVVYINEKGKNVNLDNILFYRDITIDEGNSFMVLDINIESMKRDIDEIENIIEQLKKDETINEAILMVEDQGNDLSFLTEISKSNSINRVIELNTEGDFKIQNIDNIKGKDTPMLVLQGSDNFIRTSIIGDKFEQEFVNWMRSNL